MNSLSTQLSVKAGVKFTVVLIGVLLAGCATLARSPEEIVKERSQARWNALVQRDTSTAYSYFSPGSRAVTSYEDYVVSINRGFWKSAQVEKVTCPSPDSCEVRLTIGYEFQGRGIKTPLTESWIREGSDWWYVKK